jgi:hypothetical protein
LALYDTAANILNDAAMDPALGLISSALTDPYDSQDANVVQLRQALKSLGQDLARDYQWPHLEKTHTFATVNGTANYDLPADFLRLVDQTEWNRTTQFSLGGPASSQEWHQLKAANVSGVVYQVFRVSGGQIQIHPTPTSAETVAFEYVSSYWVDSGGGTAGATPDAAAPTDGADTVCFDRRLLVTGVILGWLEGKGFDSTAARAKFEAAMARAQSNGGAAPVIRIGGGGGGFRCLDGDNLPETGYGS